MTKTYFWILLFFITRHRTLSMFNCFCYMCCVTIQLECCYIC